MIPDKIKKLNSSLVGEKCQLVKMNTAHTAEVVRWRNDPENAAMFKSKAVFTPEQHEEWLSKKLRSETEINWIILDNNGIPVGTISLYDISWPDGTAEFGRLLLGERRCRGTGLAIEAICLVQSRAKEVGLNQLYLEVFEDNLPAVNLYLKLGFEKRAIKEGLVYMVLNIIALEDENLDPSAVFR